MRHLLLTVLALGFVLSADAFAQQRAEKINMELVVGADQFHVALFITLLRERISAQNKSQRENCKKQMPHVTPPFFLSLTLGRHCRSRQGIVQNASYLHDKENS